MTTEDLSEEEINKIKEQNLKELEDGKKEYFKRREEKERKGIVEAQELSDIDKKYYRKNISYGPIPEFEYVNGNGNGNGNGNSKKSSKKDAKEDEDTKTIYPIYKYSQGIPLAETILVNKIPYFIQIIDGKPIYKQRIELSDINIVPPDRTEHISKEYEFQSFDEVQKFIDLTKNETLDSLFTTVKNILKKYIDADDDFINILTADIIFTYFQDKLGMTHYLLIVGDNNVGKSNILITFSFLGYSAILDMSITPANIYNFGSQLEEGQCIIIEDEIDGIDFQEDKKKLYKGSYHSGPKVTRMYDNNGPITNNNKRKSSRQNGFYLYCFKMFACEFMPDKIKSKGFLERIIPLKPTAGDPQYDILEIKNDAGDEQFKVLYEELMNTRKLLLMYRLLHYNETIPDIKLNIKNRYKQLTKPVIRLFQDCEIVDEITSALSKYLIEKNEEKINSLDSALLFLIIELVAEKGTILYNNQIWEKVKEKYPGNEIEGKSYTYYSEEFSTTISKTKIHSVFKNKFDAKDHKDEIKGRGLIFNPKKLNKLTDNYSIIKGIKIIPSQPSSPDTPDGSDTYTEHVDTNDKVSMTKTVENMTVLTPNKEMLIHKNNNIMTKNDTEKDIQTNGHSIEVSEVSEVSGNSKSLLFNNPLISESDLKDPNGFQYDPEIINNITRFNNSDQWFCKNNDCKVKGDKWLLMRHNCKYNNIKNKEELT